MNEINYKDLKNFQILFNGLIDSELKIIAEIVTKKTVETGVNIITDGETGDELFLLEEGIAEVSRTLTIVTSKHEFGTKERSFDRISGENHCTFGEMALFGSGKRSATVKAITECRLLVISGKEFMELCGRYPRIGLTVVSNIALLMAIHLRKTNDDVIKLTTALSLALTE